MSQPSQYPQYGQYAPAPPPAPKKQAKRVHWLGVVGIGFLCFLFGIGCHASASDSSTPAVSSAPASRPAAPLAQPPARVPAPAVEAAPAVEQVAPGTVSDGTYEVGVDMEPGRYKTAGPDQSDAFPMCYWERSKDDSGEFGSIIANEIVQGPGSVTVKSGEFAKVSGGCAWTKVS